MLYPLNFPQPLRLDIWQTALRKQYNPDLNPMGPEPIVQLPTPAPESGPDDEEPKAESVSSPGPSSGPLLGVTSINRVAVP